MFDEEIEAKELAIATLISDLSFNKFIDIDFRPCEMWSKTRTEKLTISRFQLLESIDGHMLYLELIAYDGEDFSFSIPDIIEVVSVDKEVTGKVIYKLKSHVRLFARSKLESAFASLQVAATGKKDPAERLLNELQEKFMYMTHEFTLSND